MTNLNSKSAARAVARRVQEKVSAERVRRKRLNVEDLATFMVAIDRMAAVEDWAAERIAQVQGETDRRRQEQRESAGAAFHAMYARGEAVTTIA